MYTTRKNLLDWIAFLTGFDIRLLPLYLYGLGWTVVHGAKLGEDDEKLEVRGIVFLCELQAPRRKDLSTSVQALGQGGFCPS